MIDLKAHAGARYRVTLDASDKDSPRSDRPWMYQIPAKYGHVFVHAADRLGVYCRSNRLRPRLLAVPGLTTLQDGDREFNATFPTEQLDAVAAIVKCRRRRVLSPEQRARLVERGSAGLRAFRERGVQGAQATRHALGAAGTGDSTFRPSEAV